MWVCTRHRFSSHGFTLVELVVVIAIMAVIASLILVGIMRYSQRQAQQQFVTEVTSAITEARAKTIAGLDDTTYGVYVGTSTIEFFMGSVPVAGDVANTIIEVPSHMLATSSFSNDEWYITFARLTGVPTATGTIAIGDQYTEATTTVTIFESGLVQY